MKNPHKALYEKSGGGLVVPMYEHLASVYQSTYYCARRDKAMRKLYGPAHFTWLTSGSQKYWVWHFKVGPYEGYNDLWMFTGVRGTHWETSARKVNKEIINFISDLTMRLEKIEPRVNLPDNPILPLQKLV